MIDKTCILQVNAPARDGKQGLTAGAEVIKKDGLWTWGEVAPILAWFKDKSVDEIGRWLNGPAKRKGWSYRFVKPKSQEPAAKKNK